MIPPPASPEAARRLARRRARIADAARLLPVLGAVLLLVPDLVLSGGPDGTGGPDGQGRVDAGTGATAPWLVYLFAAWAGLIGLTAWVARLHGAAGLSSDPPGDAPRDTP